MSKDYQRLSHRAQQLMWGSYAALLVVLTLNTLVLPSCNRQPNVVIWVCSILPLLVFIPALLKHRVRACAWLCFILLFYFLLSVPVAMSCGGLAPGLEVFVIVVLFIATMLYIRWRSRFEKQRACEPQTESREPVSNG